MAAQTDLQDVRHAFGRMLKRRLDTSGYAILSERDGIIEIESMNLAPADNIAAKVGYVAYPSASDRARYGPMETLARWDHYNDRYTKRHWHWTPRDTYLIAEVDHFMDARIYSDHVEVWPIYADERVWEQKANGQEEARTILRDFLVTPVAQSVRRTTMIRSRHISLSVAHNELAEAGYDVVLLEPWTLDKGHKLLPGEWIGTHRNGNAFHSDAEDILQRYGFMSIDINTALDIVAWVPPNQLPTEWLPERLQDRRDANQKSRLVLAGGALSTTVG